MYRTFVVSIATLLLGACVNTPETDWTIVNAQAGNIQRECREKRLSGELPGKVASTDCATPGIIALYRRHNYANLDLIEFERKQLRAIGEKEDRGEITEAQGRSEIAAMSEKVELEIGRRNAAANRVSTLRSKRYAEQSKRNDAEREAADLKRKAEEKLEQERKKKEYDAYAKSVQEYNEANERRYREGNARLERERQARIKADREEQEAKEREYDRKRREHWEQEEKKKKKAEEEERERQRRAR